jgi:hypothetical protein
MRSEMLIRGSQVSNDLLKCLGRLELDPGSEDRLRVIVQRMCRGTTFGETDEDLRGLGHLPERHPLEVAEWILRSTEAAYSGADQDTDAVHGRRQRLQRNAGWRRADVSGA